MSETLTQTDQTQTTDNSAAIAGALWGEPVAQQATTDQVTTDTAIQQDGGATTDAPEITDQPEVISPEEWLKREFEYENLDTFKNEWSELRKLKEQPPKAEEIKWVNDQSRQVFELIKEGKEDELFDYLSRKKQIERLEKYDISDVNQATEIIKANLQLKYKDLTPQEINRLYTRQYSIPEQPVQDMDQTDDDYAQEVASWQKQVQEKEMDIMIEAKMAKPELAKYKSQIVLPDIPKANEVTQPQGASQEDLDAFRSGFIQQLGTDYRNFKGYSTVAKDGEVELPISYTLNDDEKLAFNPTIQKAVDNIQSFLDNDLGWWNDQTKSFNVNKMQEDLYLLMNKEKVFSKIAGESAAQRFLHHQKIANNIKLTGVNNQMDIPTAVLDEKARQQKMAESVWAV